MSNEKFHKHIEIAKTRMEEEGYVSADVAKVREKEGLLKIAPLFNEAYRVLKENSAPIPVYRKSTPFESKEWAFEKDTNKVLKERGENFYVGSGWLLDLPVGRHEIRNDDDQSNQNERFQMVLLKGNIGVRISIYSQFCRYNNVNDSAVHLEQAPSIKQSDDSRIRKITFLYRHTGKSDYQSYTDEYFYQLSGNTSGKPVLTAWMTTDYGSGPTESGRRAYDFTSLLGEAVGEFLVKNS